MGVPEIAAAAVFVAVAAVGMLLVGASQSEAAGFFGLIGLLFAAFLAYKVRDLLRSRGTDRRAD